MTHRLLITLLLLTCSLVNAQTTGSLAYDIYNGTVFEQKNLSPSEGLYLKWQNGLLVNASASGGTWGSITGTLSNQTDLQTALDAKLANGDLFNLGTDGSGNGRLRLWDETNGDWRDMTAIPGGVSFSGDIYVTGTVGAGNLSGNNTGDQDLSNYLTLDGDGSALTGITPGQVGALAPDGDGSGLTGITAAQVAAIADGDTVSSLTFSPAGLGIFDGPQTSKLLIQNATIQTEDRTLFINTSDGNRIITLSGNLNVTGTASIGGTNTGDVTLAGTPDYITISGQTITRNAIDLATDITGVTPVANGGSGANTLAANNVLLGNGTSAFQTVAPSTTGNVLTSNGTTWTSAAPASGGVTRVTGTGTVNGLTLSGTVTSTGNLTLGGTLTGTASININGTVGATTPAAGTFTNLNATTFGAALEREMVRPATWQLPWRSDFGTSTTAGSGSVNASNWAVNCQTGTTTSSRSQRALILVSVSDTFTAGPAVDARVIDWSKRVTVGFAFNLVSASTNGQVFVRIGNNCSTSGNLSGAGMGIRINNTALVAQCHNGTTLNTSASLKTNTAGTSASTVIVLQSDGAGNVAVYVDNVLAVTMTGGPTTVGNATDFLAVEALNNADVSSTRVHVSPIKYYTTY